jgi:hypothetical protein
MVALNVTKKAAANSNIGNPHFQPTAKARITARRFSVVSSPWENGFVAENQNELRCVRYGTHRKRESLYVAIAASTGGFSQDLGPLQMAGFFAFANGFGPAL